MPDAARRLFYLNFKKGFFMNAVAQPESQNSIISNSPNTLSNVFLQTFFGHYDIEGLALGFRKVKGTSDGVVRIENGQRVAIVVEELDILSAPRRWKFKEQTNGRFKLKTNDGGEGEALVEQTKEGTIIYWTYKKVPYAAGLRCGSKDKFRIAGDRLIYRGKMHFRPFRKLGSSQRIPAGTITATFTRPAPAA